MIFAANYFKCSVFAPSLVPRVCNQPVGYLFLFAPSDYTNPMITVEITGYVLVNACKKNILSLCSQYRQDKGESYFVWFLMRWCVNEKYFNIVLDFDADYWGSKQDNIIIYGGNSHEILYKNFWFEFQHKFEKHVLSSKLWNFLRISWLKAAMMNFYISYWVLGFFGWSECSCWVRVAVYGVYLLEPDTASLFHAGQLAFPALPL